MFKIMLSILAFGSLAQANINLPTEKEMFQKVCSQSILEYASGSFHTSQNIYYIHPQTKVKMIARSLGTDDSDLHIMTEQFGLVSIMMREPILDFEAIGNFVWAISKTTLYKIDLSRFRVVAEFPNQIETQNPEKYEVAYGLTTFENKVFIANGSLGISVFDTKSEKFIQHLKPGLKQPNPKHISYATDVIVSQNKLIVIYDNATYDFVGKMRAYEGFAIYNIQSGLLEKLIPVDQKREAIFEPKLMIDQNKVILSSMHLFFENQISNLLSSSMYNPQRRIYQYPNGKPLGTGFISNSQLFACFITADEYGKNSIHADIINL